MIRNTAGEIITALKSMAKLLLFCPTLHAVSGK